MKKHKLKLLPMIISLMLLSAVGCEKKDENERPTINFLQPATNSIISNDTLISFMVEPVDADGTIDRVEFVNNGTLVHTITESPWLYTWSISSEENRGLFTILAIAYDNQGATGKAEIQIEVKSYLSKWVGIYEGVSHHWLTSPVEINGQWQIVTNHNYYSVMVNVNQSIQDSCLDLQFTFDETNISTSNALKFLPSGKHSASWGGGSGYGSISINFESDSLNYDLFQKCGIPCSSGIDFVIGKK